MSWSGDEKFWAAEAHQVIEDIEKYYYMLEPAVTKPMDANLIVALALAKAYERGREKGYEEGLNEA